MTTPLPRTMTTLVAALQLAAGRPSEAPSAGGLTVVGGPSDTTWTAAGL